MPAADVGEINEDELLLLVASFKGRRRQREVEFLLVDPRQVFSVGMLWPFDHRTRGFYPHGKGSRRVDGDGWDESGFVVVSTTGGDLGLFDTTGSVGGTVLEVW